MLEVSIAQQNAEFEAREAKEAREQVAGWTNTDTRG